MKFRRIDYWMPDGSEGAFFRAERMPDVSMIRYHPDLKHIRAFDNDDALNNGEGCEAYYCRACLVEAYQASFSK